MRTEEAREQKREQAKKAKKGASPPKGKKLVEVFAAEDAKAKEKEKAKG